jgi:sulfofructosephosphate aldolase
VTTTQPPRLASGSVAPAALARPTGTFAMVAMDQRESLRTMMAERLPGGHGVPDAAMVAFKLAVARELGPYASAFLIDLDYGYDRVAAERPLPDGCGLVLAADALSQPPGGVVEDTALDERVDAHRARREGVAALKLLVIWRRDARRGERVALTARFVELCREAGLASVLEPVARPTPEEEAAGTFDLDAAIVEAAAELGPLGPSLYKCQVPGRGAGPVAAIARRAERVDAVLDCPWVVLSQGVDPRDFPTAVEAVCRAGASGFLAGRALWTDTLGPADPVPLLRAHAVPRLRRLAETVDRYARPWNDKAAVA